jgi:alkyl sulfatase BDS1-like metallo-beta-lactamase superfamily hydrolase
MPPSSVDADLVALAGGADAVARRAREKLAAGAPVEAIRLTEIALAGEPENRDALETSLRAHETLEAASENFWLTSWLRRRIQSLRSALE